MIKASSYKTPVSIIESLSYLINVLRTEKRKYENAATAVNDSQFSQSIGVLAQENNQYECELASQLTMLGATVDSAGENEQVTTNFNPEYSAENGVDLPQQLLLFCRESEKQLIHAYRRTLNEPFLPEGLRTLIRKQLNGILYAFLQLKLFSSTGFFHHGASGFSSLH